MTNTMNINKTNINKLLSTMRSIRKRGNYASLMYNCEAKELFVDEFINASDYYDYPHYIKYIQCYAGRFQFLAASDILDLVEDIQDEYDYEQMMIVKEVELV